MRTYRTCEGDRLDRICQRHYGACRGVVEQVLDANRHLAARGPVYPAGLLIRLPELTPPPEEKVQVRLWD